jgi:hypothetical protein
MKLRIGDKVRFLNEVGEGVVTRIKDKNTVYVEMGDGFEIPCLARELVPIHTELIVDDEAENISLSPEATPTDTVYFVIEPDHDYQPLVNDYSIYLLNSSSFNLIFAYSVKDEEYFQTLRHGEVGPYQKVLLHQVRINFFRDYSYQKLECLLYKNTFFRAQTPIAEVIHITPEILQRSERIKHQEFRHPVLAYLLKEDFITRREIHREITVEDVEKLKSIKEFVTKARPSRSAREQERLLEKEVDLHIEELIDNTSGLSSFEMLNIQLEKFEKELDQAMASGARKITFIHGVGNGRLKHEIVSVLKTMKGVTFQDAPYKNYGFGATQVNIHSRD